MNTAVRLFDLCLRRNNFDENKKELKKQKTIKKKKIETLLLRLTTRLKTKALNDKKKIHRLDVKCNTFYKVTEYFIL